MMMSDMLLLSLMLPICAAVFIGIFRQHENVRELFTVLASLGLLAITIIVYQSVAAGEMPDLHLVEVIPGLELALRVEPLGMLFACIASLLWPVNSLYSIAYMRSNKEKKQTRFYICFALAISSTLGIAYSANLFTLFVFYELLTLSTYPLVTHKGTEAAKTSGRTYLGILMGTSIGLLLPAILIVLIMTGDTAFHSGGILQGKLTGTALAGLLALFVYGIGKAALMPMHRWLPAAMVAPTPVSALLHAVAVVKAGVFCVVKIIVYVFGLESLAAEPSADWLVYVAGFTIVMASVVALGADNLKRRLAYSTISQLSYVVMAIAMFNSLAAIGAVFHIAAHAFGKITLFFAAGAIYTASGKTDVSQLDGIGRRMPITMMAFAVGCLSMIGLPPAAGMISKWYMLMGAMDSQAWFVIVVIIISTLLNAAYFIPIVYVAFFKEENTAPKKSHGEAPVLMLVAMLITALLTLATFVHPEIPLGLAKSMLESGL